jgi:hypothetical protein
MGKISLRPFKDRFQVVLGDFEVGKISSALDKETL